MPIGVWFMLGFALGFVEPVGLFVVLAVGPFGFVTGDEVGFGFGFEFGFDGTVGNALGLLVELPVVPVALVVLVLFVLPVLPLVVAALPLLPPVAVCASAPMLKVAAPIKARVRIF